jgi:hypothetical protein
MGVIFLRNKVSGAVVDAYSIGGASPELVAAFLTAADGTTEGEYFRTGGVEDDFSMFTFARSDNATMFDSTGTLVWAPHNLLTYSEDFSNAIWVSTETSVSSNATTAPDGTLTADKLVESSATATHIIRGPTTFPDNISTIFAMCVKDAGDGRYIVLGNGNRSGQEAYATFNPVNGALENSGGGDFVSAGSTPLGNGWYLCFIELKAVSGDANDFVRITLSDIALADETRSYTGDGTSGVYIWGAHLYRSDLGGMADNPDQTVSGLEKYVPTTSAAVYLSRRNAYYYNSGWTKGGLQLESAAATNLLTYSEDMTNAEWVTTALSVGSKDGDDFFPLDEDGTTSTHFVADMVTVSTGQSYVYAADFKANENSLVQIASSNGFASKYQNFNLSSGSLGTGDMTDAGIIPLGSGVYRCWVAEPATATGSGRFLIALIDSDGSGRLPSYAGTAGNGVLARRAQMEAGSVPTSYIPTSGSTVARAAETLSIAAADLPYSATAMSISMKGLLTFADDNNDARFFQWKKNAGSSMRWTTDNSDGEVLFSQVAGGTTDTVVSPGNTFNPGVNVPFNLASRHLPTLINGAADGVAFTANETPTALPDLSATLLQLGDNNFNGYISELRMWGADIGDSGIEEVTT